MTVSDSSFSQIRAERLRVKLAHAKPLESVKIGQKACHNHVFWSNPFSHANFMLIMPAKLNYVLINHSRNMEK